MFLDCVNKRLVKDGKPCHFSSFPSAFLKKIKKTGTSLTLEAGENLFFPNISGDVILVVRGLARVYNDWKSTRQLTTVASAGDTVGIPEIFLRKKTLLSIEALNTMEVSAITRDQLWMVLETDERALYGMLRQVSAMAVDFQAGYRGFSNAQSGARVAEMVLVLWHKLGSQAGDLIQEFTPRDYSELSGIPQGQVSRLLKVLGNENGPLNLKGDRVAGIKDMETLSHIAYPSAPRPAKEEKLVAGIS